MESYLLGDKRSVVKKRNFLRKFTQQILKHFRVPGQYRENGAILVPLSILSDKIVFPLERGGFPVCLS